MKEIAGSVNAPHGTQLRGIGLQFPAELPHVDVHCSAVGKDRYPHTALSNSSRRTMRPRFRIRWLNICNSRRESSTVRWCRESGDRPQVIRNQARCNGTSSVVDGEKCAQRRERLDVGLLHSSSSRDRSTCRRPGSGWRAKELASLRSLTDDARPRPSTAPQ